MKLPSEKLVRVKIPKAVLDKIRYLCRQIHRDEWSGVLFYTANGTIRNPSKLVITLKDIFLMDKGSAGATNFKWDEDIVEYRMNHEESIDWMVGHIHSHNNMGVFFSAVDMSELNDNAPLHNIYLSIIVNNDLDIIGKIGMFGESMPAIYKKRFICKDEMGKDFMLDFGNTEIKPPDGLILYECKMEYDKPLVEIDAGFIDRMEEVIKRSTKAVVVTKDWKSPVVYDSNSNKKPSSPISSSYSLPILDRVKEEDIKDKLGSTDIYEAFGGYILRMGTLVEDDTISDALSDISIANVNESAIAWMMYKEYYRMFNVFYDSVLMTKDTSYRAKLFDGSLEYIIAEIIKTDDPAEGDEHEAATIIDSLLKIKKETSKTVSTPNYSYE